jgi:hypothetical protein
MRKRSTILVLISMLLFGLFAGYSLAEVEEVKVLLNGETIVFDTPVEVVNSRTMVPVAVIFESLGMEVKWNDELKRVIATKDGLEVILDIGSDMPRINGVANKIDSPAYIKDSRTMVPLRFVAESTGATVVWDAETRSVLITHSENDDSQTDSEISTELSYNIVDTGVEVFYTDSYEISTIYEGYDFYGQDANYSGNQASYTDNDDGTVSDNVTGLMWQQTMDAKMTYDDSVQYANESMLGGYDDWRIPTIKELFSLILFTGESGGEVAKIFYIDTDYFNQPIGDTSIGEREIDAQTWSSTKYVGETMNGDETIFGVNFIDGRIKGYGLFNLRDRVDNTGYFRLVRGNESYGENSFVDNGDGTISDLATGLMWQMSDDGQTRDWEGSLAYSEGLDLAGYDDWRLPDAKELQSIVDYSKSVQTTDSPAIDDLFVLTEMTDPDGASNYGFYWTSTTHRDGNNIASGASYVAFGEAQGEMNGNLLDVHGCGAVRSDPKSGVESSYPKYFGPQGDIQYVYNYVLSVRTINQ